MPKEKPPKKPLSPEDRQMHIQLALLALAVMIDILGFSIIIPLIPEYIQRGLHCAPNDRRMAGYGGWLLAVYALMQFLFAPVWGALSDRIGRKPILIGSLVGDAVFYVMFGLSVHSLPGQFAARILAGIFSSASLSVAQAYAADITPPHLRAMGLGYLGAAFGVGFVFGPALGGLIPTLGGSLSAVGSHISALGGHISVLRSLGAALGGHISALGGLLGQFNLSLPLFVSAGLAVVNLLYIKAKLPEPARAERAPSAAPPPSLPGRLRLMAQAVSGPVGFLYLLTFAVTFAFANLEGTFTFYLKQHFHYAERHITAVTGGVFAYVGILIVIIQGGAIRPLVKRYGEANLIVAGVGLMALGFLLFPFAGALWILLLGPMLPISLGNGLNGPSLRALVSRKSAQTAQGASLGLSASFDSLARATGPAVGGYLYRDIGQAAPYWCAGLIMSLCFLFALARKGDMTALPVPAPPAADLPAGEPLTP